MKYIFRAIGYVVLIALDVITGLLILFITILFWVWHLRWAPALLGWWLNAFVSDLRKRQSAPQILKFNYDSDKWYTPIEFLQTIERTTHQNHFTNESKD